MGLWSFIKSFFVETSVPDYQQAKAPEPLPVVVIPPVQQPIKAKADRLAALDKAYVSPKATRLKSGAASQSKPPVAVTTYDSAPTRRDDTPDLVTQAVLLGVVTGAFDTPSSAAESISSHSSYSSSDSYSSSSSSYDSGSSSSSSYDSGSSSSSFDSSGGGGW